MTTSLRVIFVLVLLDLTATDAERIRPSADLLLREQSWAKPTGRHQNHVILRRASDGQECTPDSKELERRIAALRCDPDFSQAITETECSLSSLSFAESEIRDCGSDRNGTFCVQHDMADPDPNDLARDINRECFDPPSRNCTTTCRETLKEFSERFGCCVHSDRVRGDDRYIRVLTPQLWQDCGLERPEPCGNAPGGPDLPVPDGNTSCTVSCSYTQYNALYCKHLARKAIDIYKECGDDENAMQIAQECGFNKRGRFCAGLGSVVFAAALRSPNNELTNEFEFQVYSRCIQVFANGTCPSECRDTLQEIRDEYGCCFNNINETEFDFTSFEDEDDLPSLITSYDLWSACGVETPGFCGLPSDVSVYDDLMHCNLCPIEEVISVGGNRSSGNTAAIVGGVLGAVVFLVAILIPITVFLHYRLKKAKSSPKTVPPTRPVRNRSSKPNGRSPAANALSSSDDVIQSPVAHTYDYIPYSVYNNGTGGDGTEGVYEPYDMESTVEMEHSKGSDRYSYVAPEPPTSSNIAYNMVEHTQEQTKTSAEPQDYLKPQPQANRAGGVEDDDGEYVVMFHDQDNELYG